jgi:hypothetical protein
MAKARLGPSGTRVGGTSSLESLVHAVDNANDATTKMRKKRRRCAINVIVATVPAAEPPLPAAGMFAKI